MKTGNSAKIHISPYCVLHRTVSSVNCMLSSGPSELANGVIQTCDFIILQF